MLGPIAENSVKILDSKKAYDIVAVNVGNISILADTFIIATGHTIHHMQSLADDLEDELAKLGYFARTKEGKGTGWLLLDYGECLIHIFSEDMREYYGLERLWADAEKYDIKKLLTED